MAQQKQLSIEGLENALSDYKCQMCLQICDPEDDNKCGYKSCENNVKTDLTCKNCLVSAIGCVTDTGAQGNGRKCLCGKQLLPPIPQRKVTTQVQLSQDYQNFEFNVTCIFNMEPEIIKCTPATTVKQMMEKIRSVFEIDKKQEIDLIKVVSLNGVKQDNGMEVISAKECQNKKLYMYALWDSSFQIEITTHYDGAAYIHVTTLFNEA